MQVTLHLTDWASPDAIADLPDDPAAAARGRNGWFVPQQILVRRGEQVQLAVRSRRTGESAPIQLHLSRPAALALGRALLAAAANPAGAEVPPAEPSSLVPVEVEWHPEYRGGDFYDTGELTVIEVAAEPGAHMTDALVAAAFTAMTGQDPIHMIRWVEVAELVS